MHWAEPPFWTMTTARSRTPISDEPRTHIMTSGIILVGTFTSEYEVSLPLFERGRCMGRDYLQPGR